MPGHDSEIHEKAVFSEQPLEKPCCSLSVPGKGIGGDIAQFALYRDRFTRSDETMGRILSYLERSSQFSTVSPSMSTKWRTFPVIKVHLWLKAVDAMRTSSIPTRRPLF